MPNIDFLISINYGGTNSKNFLVLLMSISNFWTPINYSWYSCKNLSDDYNEFIDNG